MAEPTDEDREKATAIVERVLGRPLGQSTATELVDVRGGLVLLARTPVTDVASVTVDGDDVVTRSNWSAFGMLHLGCVNGWRRAEVTYTAGPDPEYPDVLAVVEGLAGRIAAGTTAAGAVRQESVGAYSVTYDAGAMTRADGLTASEAAVLDRYAVRTELV